MSDDQRVEDTIFCAKDLVGILGHVKLDRRVLRAEEMRQQSACMIRELEENDMINEVKGLGNGLTMDGLPTLAICTP